MTANRTRAVDNLVMGVSQQASEARRYSQCVAQYDCFNSPADGAWARNGFEVVKFHSGQLVTDGFFYELFRGAAEHYLALIVGGNWAVYNLVTGELCTISDASGSAYRALSPGNLDKDAWRALTVDDFTYVANRTIGPVMLADVSPTRPREGMLFFRSGGYMTRYTVAIRHDSDDYKWTYTTPDNSTEGNAEFVNTGLLASTFYRAMTGLNGDLPQSGVGGQYAGDLGGGGLGGATSTMVVTNGTLPAGFNVEIKGNLLRIWHDTDDFELDITDGAGNTHTEAFKDTCRSYTDLPKTGFEGFTLKVQGLKSAAADDYYVRYTTVTSADGYWQECVGPGVPTSLDPVTMPHALVNTGVNTFEWRTLSWSTRIAGDEDTAPDPRFVGKRIEDLFYHKKRLGILSEAAAEWSKSRNPYTHFPDSVQTILATDRISFDLSTGGAIALSRKTVEVDESLYVWAQGVQFRVSSGQQDSFKQETAEAPAATFYEFAEKANFGRIGSSLYFATEPGAYATIRNLVFQNGRPAGDVDVTAHVPDYIPAGVRQLTVSDTLRCIFVRSEGSALNHLYLYNFLLQDRQFVQSAWQVWRLPSGTITWASIYKSDIYVALQRDDGLFILRSSLRSRLEDEPGKFHLRMDLRITEAETVVAYNSMTDQTSISLPHDLVEDASLIRVAIRTTGGDFIRGQTFPVTSKTTNRILVVEGDLSDAEFYVGVGIRSERLEGEFFLRGEKGVTDTERLTVGSFKLNYDGTGYSRVEANIGANREVKVAETGTPLDHYTTPSLAGTQPLRRGQLDLSVNALSKDARITLVNDSVFPSRWISAVYRYQAVIKATPDGA